MLAGFHRECLDFFLLLCSKNKFTTSFLIVSQYNDIQYKPLCNIFSDSTIHLQIFTQIFDNLEKDLDEVICHNYILPRVI